VAEDRLGDDARRSFTQAVEAQRLGYLTANDRKALYRWRSHSARLEARSPAGAGLRAADGGGLTGAALERAVGALAATNPDLVAFRYR
jgi:hypothetical protein